MPGGVESGRLAEPRTCRTTDRPSAWNARRRHDGRPLDASEEAEPERGRKRQHERVTIARTLCGRAAIGTADKAMEVTGGGAFYRRIGLERLFRDVQGARYHPLQEKAQLRYAGRLALGLDIDG